MADQPARALIVYGDGLMRGVAPRHSNLHAVVAAGCCGFLALRSQPTSGNGDDRVVAELAQLLDIYDIYHNKARAGDDVNSGSGQIPSLSERFMGMKGGMFTNSGPAAALGEQAGFSILELQEGNDNTSRELSVTASQLLTMLGLQDDEVLDTQDAFELLLLHLTTGKEDVQEQVTSQLVDWVDELIGAVQDLAQPGSRAASHLYLVVVLGYGSVESSQTGSLEGDGVPRIASDHGLVPELNELVPLQTYAMKGGHPLNCIRDDHPLLVAYYLNGVTRRDEAKCFKHHEFQNVCGNLTILIDRFLHEVAFKLWKAPKYGA